MNFSESFIIDYVNLQLKLKKITLGWYGDILDYSDIHVHMDKSTNTARILDFLGVGVDITYKDNDKTFVKTLHIPLSKLVEFRRNNRLEDLLDE